jgi:demethylmenaquinone methyltransferase/2-methoxy-6-polyprenyl-1,4-benzoquinol methylase
MPNDTPPTGEAGKETSFGFRTVSEGERQGLVNAVFSSVASRYDLMNDLMSAGLHRLWKGEFVGLIGAPRGDRAYHLLDVAGGTGDIAIRYADFAGPNAIATMVDISTEMLEEGRRKVAEKGLAGRIRIAQGNAEALPFPDRTFDAYTIAFGIRNVTHIDVALREAHRVLKIGGRFLCLEFSECQVPLLDRIYDFHSFEIIPRLGELAAGSAEPYRYLVESIRRFPNQAAFAGMIREAGFEQVTVRNLSGGIAAIHTGWKL